MAGPRPVEVPNSGTLGPAIDLKRRVTIVSFEILDDVEFEQKPREYAGGPKGPRPRTEEQKPYDEAFKRAMDGRGVLAMQIAPEDADYVGKRVISAARFYKRSVTEGQPKPGKAEGTVILTWKIRVPVRRGPNKASTEQESQDSGE